MEQVVKCEAGGFASLVSAALEERSLSVSAIWQLLLAVREPAPLNLLMDEIRKQPGAEFFFQAGNGLGVPPCSPWASPAAGRSCFLTPHPLPGWEPLFFQWASTPVSLVKQLTVWKSTLVCKHRCFACGSVLSGFVMRKPFESWPPPSCNNNQLEAHQTESMGFIGGLCAATALSSPVSQLLALSFPTLKPKLCFSPNIIVKISCKSEEHWGWWSCGAGEGGCAEPSFVCWPCGPKAVVHLPAVRCLWCSCLHLNSSSPSPLCSAWRNQHFWCVVHLATFYMAVLGWGKLCLDMPVSLQSQNELSIIGGEKKSGVLGEPCLPFEFVTVSFSNMLWKTWSSHSKLDKQWEMRSARVLCWMTVLQLVYPKLACSCLLFPMP